MSYGNALLLRDDTFPRLKRIKILDLVCGLLSTFQCRIFLYGEGEEGRELCSREALIGSTASTFKSPKM